MSYTHRERVLAAFRHEQPDRVPMDLMGNASMLLDEPYLLLRDHLGLAPIPPVRAGQPASYYDERILEHFDIDFRRVFLPVHPEVDVVHHADGSFTDPWKIRYIREGPFVNSVENPLAGITTLAELEEYRWPRPQEMFASDGLRDAAKRLCEETDYAIVARNPLTQGFLDRACYLMGMGDFFVAIRLYPDLAQAIFDGILEVYRGVYAMFLEEVGPYVQMVETADDLGTSGSLMVSPKMYRQHIKPAEAALCAAIRERAPDAFIFRHCDGSVAPLLEDFIETGTDILNPVQTSLPGMDAAELKRQFGERLIFHGGVEGYEGPRDAVVEEVRRLIDAFAPGGGYVFASCNHIIEAPPENVVAMFETARDYSAR